VNAQLAPEEPEGSTTPQGARALLRTVVITDLCDSTALVERLGDAQASELIRNHDRLLRGLIRQHRGQEIDKTDGFLSLFERPIQAVAFALDYQRGLQGFSREHGVEIKARIGIHVGEIMSWQNEAEDIAKGAKPVEIEGLAKPVAARLMGLALPGQILLSGVAYTLAHRAEGELGAILSRLQWRHHGRFRFKGVLESIAVYEIGEPEIAPFKAPAWSGKAHREVPLWRRPLMLAGELLVLLAVTAIPAWYFLKPEPAIAFAERDWVVLGDLRNLTGDSRFDDSLEQAFRIGLEQSRHVNVLSDLQVRDTLQRMQRDRDTNVDRSAGAEIAMREGARALVLPTLAEVGGRLRFTAEIVDPETQATVYSDFADGRGSDAVLSLVDEVNRKLRARLGEAVTQVNESSKPLEKVTTADLDALRSYSRAIELVDQRRDSEAASLLERALEMDPSFARAHLELGVLRYENGHGPQALDHFKRAASNPERMSNRELRLAQSWLATLNSSQSEAIRQWRLLDLEYPEFFSASGALAWSLLSYENNLSDALSALKRNTDEKNPRRGYGLLLLASVLTAKGEFEAAADALEDARTLGVTRIDSSLIRLHSASRNFEAAMSMVASSQELRTDSGRASLAVLKSTIELDSGRVEDPLQTLEDSLASTNPSSSWARHVLSRAHASLSVAVLGSTTDPPNRLHIDLELLARNIATLSLEGGAFASSVIVDSLQALWVSRMSGGLANASPHIDVIETRLALGRFSDIDHWLTVLKAENELQSGNSTRALEIIEAALGENESVAARFVAARAQLEAGQHALALESAQRLYQSRGRAYTEIWGSSWFLPVNVMISNFGHCLAIKAASMNDAPDSTKAETERAKALLSQSNLSSTTTDPAERACSLLKMVAPIPSA
jgi:putative peptide modification system cyclase